MELLISGLRLLASLVLDIASSHEASSQVFPLHLLQEWVLVPVCAGECASAVLRFLSFRVF